MTDLKEDINYRRIAKAIAFINANFKNQPTLNEIAEAVHLSPYHFQRLFSKWAGISPKKFMQFLSVEYAKNLLQDQSSLFDAAFETGLSGTSRLHDLFVSVEGMTPGEYKNGGEKLNIAYNFYASPFGEVILASTEKGVCRMEFIGDRSEAKQQLVKQFPKAKFLQNTHDFHKNALAVFEAPTKGHHLKLHLNGTAFQLKVWKALLEIPFGHLTTYGTIANIIDNPKSQRAVGTAVGRNPIAYLIPCHRVIRASGMLGNYEWGETRKQAIIGWEASRKTRISN